MEAAFGFLSLTLFLSLLNLKPHRMIMNDLHGVVYVCVSQKGIFKTRKICKRCVITATCVLHNPSCLQNGVSILMAQTVEKLFSSPPGCKGMLCWPTHKHHLEVDFPPLGAIVIGNTTTTTNDFEPLGR